MTLLTFVLSAIVALLAPGTHRTLAPADVIGPIGEVVQATPAPAPKATPQDVVGPIGEAIPPSPDALGPHAVAGLR
jgi:hypothetical protein